jgi:hypothetical protein
LSKWGDADVRRLGLWLIVALVLAGGVRPAAAVRRDFSGGVAGGPGAAACVEAAVLRGYPGSGARLFPSAPVVREELVAALVRFLGLEGEAESLRDAAPGFRDAARILQVCPWARGYLAAAQRAGLLFPGGEFGPGQPASRLWAAELAVRALGLQVEAELRMADRPAFSDLAGLPVDRLGCLAAAADRGLIEGFGDGTFRPEDPLTWPQLALMLERMASRRPAAGGEAVLLGWLVLFRSGGAEERPVFGMVPPGRWAQAQCFLDRGFRWRGSEAYALPVVADEAVAAACEEKLLGRLVVARAVRLVEVPAASFRLLRVREVLLVPGLPGGLGAF